MVISSRPRTPGSCSSLDYHEQMYTNLSMVQQHRNRKANFKKLRHSSSSPTSTSSADSLPNVNASRNHPYHRIVPHEQFPYVPSETMRSSRSMPGLSIGSTSDGLPCPVHHMQKVLNLQQLPNFVPRRAGSMYELRASPAPSFYVPRAISPAPSFYAPMPQHGMYAQQSHYGSLRSIRSSKSATPFLISNPVMAPQQPLIMPALPPIPMHLPPMPPTYLLPPGARPQPLVIPAEPLPVRNMNKRAPPLAIEYKKKKKYSCCHGPMPVVWFVVILVSFGVILGIILWATLG